MKFKRHLSIILALLFILVLIPFSAQATTNVRFVKDNGAGTKDGISAANAMDSLTTAFTSLAATGGTVVVCGPLTISADFKGNEGATGVGAITMTSVFAGTDYRSAPNNAVITLANNFYLYGPVTIEKVEFTVTKASAMFFCNWFNFTVGNEVNLTYSPSSLAQTSIQSGCNVATTSLAADVSFAGNQTVTVNSGTWAYVRGGNRRAAGASPIGTMSGSVELIINGGTFTAPDSATLSGSNINSASGMNSLTGSAYYEINGGTFACSILGMARLGTNDTGTLPNNTGDIEINITGGVFNGALIGPSIDSVNMVTSGSFDLTISGGVFNALTSITAAGATGTSTATVLGSLTSLATGYTHVYTYSDTTTADTTTAATTTADTTTAATTADTTTAATTADTTTAVTTTSATTTAATTTAATTTAATTTAATTTAVTTTAASTAAATTAAATTAASSPKTADYSVSVILVAVLFASVTIISILKARKALT